MKLTTQQKAAADFPGNILLQACPGSGKTRTIVEKLVREIEQLRDTAFSVACITYTNAAVQEIDTRVAAFLMPGDERHYVVSTIHSFCLHSILRPFAWRVPGFDGSMEVLTRDREEFEQIVTYAAGKINLYNLRFADFEAFANLSRNAAGAPAGSALQNEMVRKAAPHYWARAEKLGFIDFANILYKSYCLLRDHPEIGSSLASRFPSFLMDEFQDTSDVQIEILRLIHQQGKTRFFLVGDPYQSIFGFAGARPELVTPFASEIGAKADLTLSENFRSNPAIVAHAELLFPRHPAMESKGKNCLNKEVPQFIWNNTLNAITDQFLPEMARLGIAYGDAAILARNWTALIPVAQRLRNFAVPIVGPGARPYRRGRLFVNLAEQLCGAVMDGFKYRVRQLERAMFLAIQDMTGESRFDVFSYEGRLTAVELVRCAEEHAQHGGAEYWLDNMARDAAGIMLRRDWIDESQKSLFSASVADMKSDMIERDVDIANMGIADLGIFANPSTALRLMTIHNAKGHEYKAVAIIGLRDGTLPDFRAKSDEEVEAEKRLFYVGVTRAEILLMYIGEPDRWNNPPCRFLGGNGVGMI